MIHGRRQVEGSENQVIVNSFVVTDDLGVIDIYHSLKVPVTEIENLRK